MFGNCLIKRRNCLKISLSDSIIYPNGSTTPFLSSPKRFKRAIFLDFKTITQNCCP